MQLVIAEKPSVAQSLSRILGVTTRKDGYLEGKKYIVSWCFGHLAGLADASVYDERYAKWKREDLPILPCPFRFEISPDKRDQFSILKELMNREDVTEVINACDAGREGELIFRSVYYLADCQKPMKRLWISSMEDEAIREGFQNLRPGSDFDGLYKSALCRAKADWLVGINATRYFSLLYGTKLNVGRVMSPTLSLLVERESTISAFVPEDYYTVNLGFGEFNAVSERFPNKAEAEKLAAACQNSTAIVKKIHQQEKQESAPALYDLTSLQRDANRLLGYVAFKYLISEYYSRDMSIKTKSAKYAKMQRGEYQSTICPYGYRKSADGRMEPDPEAAAVVLLIFQLAAEGKNAPSIARDLYKWGIPTPAEYKIAKGQKTHDVSRTHGIWCESTIVRYLADERYTGTYIIGKRAVLEVGGNNSRFKDRSKWYIIPDHHPAIVDKALFDKVQVTVRRFSQPHKKQRNYLLKGIVFCGCCDHALSYVANKQPYFHCRRSQAYETGPCHDLKIDAEELEQVIWGTIKAQLEAVLSIRADGSICLDTVVAERTEYEKQIEALEDSKQSLFEQYIMGEIDVATYKSEKAACDAAILKAKNAYASIAAQAKKKKEEQNRQSCRTEIAQAITNAEGLTLELVNLLIEKVYVFPDKRIEIMYKVQDLFD